MLEMINPTAGDALRFAATVVKVRSELSRAMKTDPAKAQARAVEIFCAPPAAARRMPDVNRLRDDTQRFFGWKAAQWKAFESPVKALLASAQTSTVTHDGLKVKCYRWGSANTQDKQGKQVASKGRMLLCHGWEGYAYNFALLISKAVEAGFEVHAFDHLAHGQSEGTQSGLPIVLETLLTVAKHVAHQHGPIDVLVGHSLGGAGASWATAHQAIKPKRLVLLAPFYDTYTLSGLWAKAHLLSGDVRAALQKGLEESSGKTFDDFMPPSLAPLLSQQPQLKVLIVHDKADKITAFKHSAQMAQLGKNITLYEAKKLGHIDVLADEACANTMMDFVQS
jgi:pimeloyl-ACP methyl ester carboxylesterase